MDTTELKAVEMEALDLEQFEGAKKKIDKVENMEVSSQFNSRGKQWCVRVLSEPVMTSPKGNEIRASDLFNLVEDANGKILGWHPKGKLGKFLDKMKVKHPNELIGKTALLKLEKKNDMQFLRFVQ